MSSRRQSLADLCRQHGVAILYVFGSRAGAVWEWLEGSRARLDESKSDVDFAIRPARWFELKDKVTLAIALEDLLDVGRVDLVVLPEANPFVAANAIRGNRLFADDEHAADEYDLYILRRAGDLAPLERERIALILGRES